MKNAIVITMDGLTEVEGIEKAVYAAEEMEMTGFQDVHVPVAGMMLEMYPEDGLDVVALVAEDAEDLDTSDLIQAELSEKYPDREIAFHVVEYGNWMDCVDVFEAIDNPSHFWVYGNGSMGIVQMLRSLAKTYGTKVERVLDIAVDTEDPSLLVIVDERELDRAFEFFTTTRDFDRLADVEAFEECFGTGMEEAVTAMKKIANACESCDPYKYKSGLKELGKALDEVFPEYGKVAEYLRVSYGNLLDDEPLYMIKRFIDKNMYLQAIVFMDALMPEQYVAKGILRFNQKSDNAKWARKEDKLMHLGIVNYMFGKLIDTQIDYLVNGSKNASYALSEVALLKKRFYHGISTGKFDLSKTNLKDNATKSWQLNETHSSKSSRPKYPFVCLLTVDAEKRSVAGYLLLMHKVLKNCVNFYECNETFKVETGKLQTVLGLYYDLAKYLLYPENQTSAE